LVYFPTVLVHFTRFGMLCREKSGNPGVSHCKKYFWILIDYKAKAANAETADKVGFTKQTTIFDRDKRRIRVHIYLPAALRQYAHLPYAHFLCLLFVRALLKAQFGAYLFRLA
jgi:hypothetical protein